MIPSPQRLARNVFGPPADALPADEALVQWAVSNQLLTGDQLKECLLIRLELMAEGQPGRLEEILLKRGYLTPEQLARFANPSIPKTTIGKYRVIRVLGRGGMATVMEAEDPELRRMVALKVLPEDRADPPMVERFHREAKIAAQLNHPNIVGIHEVGTARDEQGTEIHFIAMELVAGRTLAEVIAERKTPRHKLLEMLQAVAEAAAYAHGKEVVHRDLKPANVLVDQEGKVYLTDFGLAHAEMFSADLTRSKEVLGTPQYMAPEQVKGRLKEIGPQTDVYALGVMLYEILTGRAPFTGKKSEELYQAIVFEEPEPPRKRMKSLDRDVEVICLKALSKERLRRYATANEFGEDLKRYLSGEPILARPPSVGYRLKKAVLRHAWGVGTVSGALLIGLGVAGYWWKTNSARKQDQSALAEENRKREEAERQAERMQAEVVYRQAGRDLYVLRLWQYQPGWRLTEDRFGEFEKLENACREQMGKTGDSAEGWWVVGCIREALGDESGAELAYDQGLVAEEDHSGCLLYKARLLILEALNTRFSTEYRESKREETEGFLKQAVALLERGIAGDRARSLESDLANGYWKLLKQEGAREFCDQMLEKWGPGKEFREEFFLIRGLADWSRLIEDCTSALKDRASYSDAYYWRGIAWQQKGDLPRAGEDLTAALRINPRFMRAYSARGLVYLHQGRLDEAIADFTTHLQIHVNCAEGHFLLARAYEEQREYGKATQEYAAVLELDPRSPETYVNRAGVYIAQRDLEIALADCKEALKLDPDFPKAHNQIGIVYKLRMEYGAAIESFDRALKLDPKHAEAYFNRGCVQRTLKEYDKALGDFEMARELYEKEPRKKADAYANLGHCHYALGKCAEAIEDVTNAIGIRPDFVEAYVTRANAQDALARLSQPQDAQRFRLAAQDYRRALGLAPPDWEHRGMIESYLKSVQDGLASLGERE